MDISLAIYLIKQYAEKEERNSTTMPFTKLVRMMAQIPLIPYNIFKHINYQYAKTPNIVKGAAHRLTL